MRVMVLVKGTKESESGRLPSAREIFDMGQFNEELVRAGVLLAGEGLHASAEGARVRFSRGERIVTKGPFPETGALVAGYWIWQVGSMQDAITWLKRAPFEGIEIEVEIRPILELEEIAPSDPTGELRAHEARRREQVEKLRK